MSAVFGSDSPSSPPEGADDGTRETFQQIVPENEKMVHIGKNMPSSETNASEKDCVEVFSLDDGVPQVGMVFQSEESAYEFYNAYARKVGFSVRKSNLSRLSDGTLRKRLFVCAKQGYWSKDSRRDTVKERAQTRTGCNAHMWLKFEKDGRGIVSGIVYDHNHALADPTTLYMLRSQKRARPTKADAIDSVDVVTARITNGFQCTSGELRGDENVGGLELSNNVPLDIWNVSNKSYLHAKGMKSLKEGDVQIMLNYFKRMEMANPSFFYAVQVDKDDHMTNFFWADTRSIVNYSYFGDAVCFDTTFRAGNYSLPFAPFLGVNHHRQTILFGAALLLDETIDSFVWLFEMWIKAMSGRQPQTILTEQCSTIEKAVVLVLPETRHRLCLRHLILNAAKLLPWVYSCDTNFLNEFKNWIYGFENEGLFLLQWDLMLKKYTKLRNKWVDNLFHVRDRWAPAYGRDSFCADMATIYRSESIKELFRKNLNRNLPLSQFINSYEEVMVNQREKELREDFNSKQTEPILCLEVPMLKQAAKKYTRKVFEMFQEEFKNWLCCNAEICGESGTIYTYKVTQFGQHIEYLIKFDSSNGTVTCSCKMFEFVGILCRHVMKVLNHRNIFDLPPKYTLRRWTKDAKARDSSSLSNQADRQAFVELRYRELFQKAVAVAARGAITDESHTVATHALDKALEDVEAALKTETSRKCQTSSSPNHPQQTNEKTGEIDQVSVENWREKRPVDLSSSVRIVAPNSTQGSCDSGDNSFRISASSQAGSAHNLDQSCIRDPFCFPGVVMHQLPFPASSGPKEFSNLDQRQS